MISKTEHCDAYGALNMITIFNSHYILTFFTITISIEASMNQV